MTTSTTTSVDTWSREDWSAVGCLNVGVMYLSKSLEMVVYNGLAAQLLDIAVPIGATVPLSQYFAHDREEYQVFHTIVLDEKQLRNHVVTWTVGGSIRHVLMDSYKEWSEQGIVTGMYITMKDLGNFALLEQHMQKTDKLATVGKIAAGIAHEIRNPMTTIKGFLQVLEHRFTSKAMADEIQYAKVMLQEIDRVNSLVGELLLLSKPHNVEKKPCSLKAVIDELNPLIQSQTLLRNIDYSCDVAELPDTLADSQLMKQVVLNLVKNAIEAMEAGGTLKLSATVDGPSIRLDVADTGPGIPYYLIDKIFDAFYTTKDKGTGLGLPICQRIVTDHDGEIRVSSKGFGTTFTVLIPIFNQSLELSS